MKMIIFFLVSLVGLSIQAAQREVSLASNNRYIVTITTEPGKISFEKTAGPVSVRANCNIGDELLTGNCESSRADGLLNLQAAGADEAQLDSWTCTFGASQPLGFTWPDKNTLSFATVTARAVCRETAAPPVTN